MALPRIFETFYRGDASRTEPGSGFGLNLVKPIDEASGGSIIVDPGKGSVFTVLLPHEMSKTSRQPLPASVTS